MWLRPDVAKALLLVGLLLTAVAMGGEQATSFLVDAATPVAPAPTGDSSEVLPLDAGCNVQAIIAG